jgi:hypothetical protein
VLESGYQGEKQSNFFEIGDSQSIDFKRKYQANKLNLLETTVTLDPYKVIH